MLQTRYCTLLLLCSAALSAETWIDRGEYDLVLAIRAEASPAKQLELIQGWKQKYPKTEMRQVRDELALSAWTSVNDVPKIVALAKDMAAASPDGFTGLYWLTLLTPALPNASADLLTAAQQAAKKLPETADRTFAPGKLATGLPDADWKKRRAEIDVLSHRTLGWTAWKQGSLDTAESEFRTCLGLNAQAAEISGWLGALLAAQNKPERRTDAIWHLARASTLDGEGALSASRKREVRDMLDRVYRLHRGDAEGLEQIVGQTTASPFPPEHFRIETAEQAALRKFDEQLAQTNPELLTWLRISRQLEGPDAEKNFQTLKGTPAGKLKGWVVRHTPATKPTEIVLAIKEPVGEDAVIKLDAALAGKAEPGTLIEFEGAVPDSWTAQPFSVTFRVEKDKVTGWPTPGKR